MVYCGKPSRACHVCRARHTRCDAKPEGCTQCARARRPCPGYRKEEDLLFRNENEKVALKVTAREKERLSATNTGKSTTVVRFSEVERDFGNDLLAAQQRRVQQLSLTINPNTEDLAECYFFANFMTGLEGPSFGFFQRLVALCKLQAADEHLFTSCRAASLASFAYHVHDVNVLNASRREYLKAIQLTNLSLKSSINAKKDSTLISSLLLGVFEIITASSNSSLEAWAQHIRGAAALIRLRDYDQAQTPEGCELFLQATAGLISACIQRQIPLPEDIIELTKIVWCSKVFGDPTPEHIAGYSLRLACMKFNQLRACWGPDSSLDVESALIQSLEIDDTVTLISRNPPAGYKYETHFTETGSGEIVFKRRYHVYPSIRVATIWNHVRMLRCLIHTSTMKLLLLDRSRLFPTLTMESYLSQLRRSIDVIRKLQQDILASVPFALGFIRRTDAGEYEITNTRTTRAGNGYFVMGSLFIAGINIVKTKDVEGYCVHWLKFIGEEMGIQQASVLARAVETRKRVFPSTWGIMELDIFKDLPESEHPSSTQSTYTDHRANEAVDNDIRGSPGRTACCAIR